MTLQEKIQKKADEYGKVAPVFVEGAEFVLSNQWISVDEELPCNNEELMITDDKIDTLYVVAVIRWHIIFSRMRKLEGKWFWENDEPTHWFPIPKSPK